MVDRAGRPRESDEPFDGVAGERTARKFRAIPKNRLENRFSSGFRGLDHLNGRLTVMPPQQR
jgi:hypothetical protein